MSRVLARPASLSCCPTVCRAAGRPVRLNAADVDNNGVRVIIAARHAVAADFNFLRRRSHIARPSVGSSRL